MVVQNGHTRANRVSVSFECLGVKMVKKKMLKLLGSGEAGTQMIPFTVSYSSYSY